MQHTTYNRRYTHKTLVTERSPVGQRSITYAGSTFAGASTATKDLRKYVCVFIGNKLEKDTLTSCPAPERIAKVEAPTKVIASFLGQRFSSRRRINGKCADGYGNYLRVDRRETSYIHFHPRRVALILLVTL